MDLQTYIDNAVLAARKKSLAKSDQLTIGEILLKLDPILINQESIKKEYNNYATVIYDFGYMHPKRIDSWRGAYEELALDYTEHGDLMNIHEFYKMLKDCIGKEFQGYKGGEYTMSKHTPVWVSNYGSACYTAVIDIVDNEYEVIIITGYRTY